MRDVTIEEWATFLENNSHLQGTGNLKRASGTMCCLGALCELSEIPSVTTTDSDYIAYIFDGGVPLTLIPSESFMVKYGLLNDGRPLTEEVEALSMMNDSGIAWKEVASTLRKWKELGWIHDPI